MLFQEFTAGEFLVRSCRRALQARIAAESRSYSKIFCNDRVSLYQEGCISLSVLWITYTPVAGFRRNPKE